MIIVDASVWVRALVDDGEAGEAARVALVADLDWAAPAHLPVEVLRTLRRYEMAGLLTREQADRFATQVAEAEIRYTVPEPWLVHAVWRLRHNINAYDAAYVALAAAQRVPLVTLDERLARAAASAGTEVVIPTRR